MIAFAQNNLFNTIITSFRLENFLFHRRKRFSKSYRNKIWSILKSHQNSLKLVSEWVCVCVFKSLYLHGCYPDHLVEFLFSSVYLHEISNYYLSINNYLSTWNWNRLSEQLFDNFFSDIPWASWIRTDKSSRDIRIQDLIIMRSACSGTE